MKKTLLFAAAALFVAGMTVSCGNKNAEEATDTLDTVVEEVEATVEEATETASCCEAEATCDNSAMLAAAKEAGQAKCECYKKDAASVENCIRALISAKYAQYQGNDEFTKAMEAEYKNCIKEKASAAVKDASDKAVKEGAKALSNALTKKN